jgi:biopolymer transport protein ExbD
MIGLQTPPRRRSADREAGLLPLINIVFLLLAFYLIAGHLSPSAPFAVTPPEQDGVALETSADTVIHIARDGSVAIDGERVDADALSRSIAAMDRQGAQGVATIRLVADARTDAAQVVAILGRLRDEGVETVDLVTRAP